jgi:hypothetical protein
MTSEYTHTISMLAPESLWASAGALIACLSNNQADLGQFRAAKWQPDYDGCNNSSKAHHVQAVLAAAAGQYTPQRPAFDTQETIDMVAVLETIDTMQVITALPESGLITVVPGALIIGIDIDAAALAAACGLSRVVESP